MPLQTFKPVPQVRHAVVPEQNPLAQGMDAGIAQVPLPLHIAAGISTPAMHICADPHSVVALLFPLSTHADTPVMHDVVPVLQGLVGWQVALGTHAAQTPV